MRIYSSVSATPMTFDGVAKLTRRDLTPASTVQDACHAFIWSPAIQSMLTAGSPRAHEPYLQLAKHFGTMTLAEWSCSIFASDWRDAHWGKLSSGTINGIRSKCNKLGRWLLEAKLIESNGWGVIGRSAVSPPVRDTRVLTADDFSALLAYLDPIRPYTGGRIAGYYGDLVRFMRETGIRYSEALACSLDAVDFSEGVYTVVSTHAKNRETREVVLSPKALAILRKYEHIACTRDGRFFPFGYSSLRCRVEEFNAIRRAEGLPTIFLHLTRHTAITEFSVVASSIEELRSFSGHTSLAGLEPYLHPGSRHRASIRSKLQALNGTP